MKYFESIQKLAASLAMNFDVVYYNAEIIVNDKNRRVPAVPQGDEYVDLSPSDQKEILYIRRNGDDAVTGDLRIGSCVKSYKMATPIRIVYFRDHTDLKDHWVVLAKLMQAVLVQGTQLSRIIRDKWSLARSESTGAYNFGATTAYFALDVTLLWQLDIDTCDDDCVTLANPVTTNIAASIF